MLGYVLVVVFGTIGIWFLVALARRQARLNRLRDAFLEDYADAVEAPPSADGLAGDDAFEVAVDRAVSSLPPRLRGFMENVEIVVEDEPPSGRRYLGLYHGTPLTRRSSWYAFALPDKISIYRGPIERMCGGIPGCLEAEVRHVVLHEVAHHFGISDARLIEIGRY